MYHPECLSMFLQKSTGNPMRSTPRHHSFLVRHTFSSNISRKRTHWIFPKRKRTQRWKTTTHAFHTQHWSRLTYHPRNRLPRISLVCLRNRHLLHLRPQLRSGIQLSKRCTSTANYFPAHLSEKWSLDELLWPHRRHHDLPPHSRTQPCGRLGHLYPSPWRPQWSQPPQLAHHRTRRKTRFLPHGLRLLLLF